MQQPSKTCARCGKVFYKKPSHSMRAWEDVKFCSYVCYWQAKRKVYICGYCGTEFNRQSYGKGDPTYCSRDCVAKAQSQIRTMPRQSCEVCGSAVTKARARFCSRECKVIWYRGENVYNYLGEDARDFPHDFEYLTFWMERAENIRQRDKVCQHCGKTPKENGRALDVHHIVPYRMSQDNSPSNLIALCRSCHTKAERNLT